MDNFNIFYYKIIKKNNKFSLMNKYYRKLPWNIGIFSTQSKSKKNLPYRKFAPNWNFSQFTRKLPIAKYSFLSFVSSANIRSNLSTQRKQKKTSHMGDFFVFFGRLNLVWCTWKQRRVERIFSERVLSSSKFRKYLILGNVSIFLPIPQSNNHELSLS